MNFMGIKQAELVINTTWIVNCFPPIYYGVTIAQ